MFDIFSSPLIKPTIKINILYIFEKLNTSIYDIIFIRNVDNTKASVTHRLNKLKRNEALKLLSYDSPLSSHPTAFNFPLLYTDISIVVGEVRTTKDRV